MGQNGKSNCRLLAQLAETPAAATQPSHMDPQGQFTHPTTPQPSLLPLRLWVAAARSQRGVWNEETKKAPAAAEGSQI